LVAMNYWKGRYGSAAPSLITTGQESCSPPRAIRRNSPDHRLIPTIQQPCLRSKPNPVAWSTDQINVELFEARVQRHGGLLALAPALPAFSETKALVIDDMPE
jgi:hypothetical protein